ncbi:MAG TPA: hypothetical protein VGD22_14105 [Sphingobacteriaceae bacterium]
MTWWGLDTTISRRTVGISAIQAPFSTALFVMHERYATPHITPICTDGGLWLPSVPDKISPSAGREPGKGHWLVS